MTKFKVGDRCAMYENGQRNIVTITVVDIHGMLACESDDTRFEIVHPRQCRKLRPKAKPREFWINGLSHMLVEGFTGLHLVAKNTEPENLLGWIHVKEIRKKK